MRKRKLIKMRFNIPNNSPLIKLFGLGRLKIPIEHIYYHTNDCSIIRVNKGGTCRLVVIYDNSYSFFNDYNLPFAILMSDVI